jgi:hypothetical protein
VGHVARAEYWAWNERIQVNSRTQCTPEAYRLNFSIYQPGIDFICPYSSRPIKPLNPLSGVGQGLFSGTQLEIPLIN